MWILFLVLFCFWILLSGNFKPLYIFLGIVCCAGVSLFSHNIFFAASSPFSLIKKFFKLLLYLPYLLHQIVLSNIDVAYRVLHPKMPISPEMITLKTKLKSNISKVIYANSITLTPGTVTVDIEDDKFIVHALDKKHADDLLKGEMEDKVNKIEEG